MLGYSLNDYSKRPPEAGCSLAVKGNGTTESGYSSAEKGNGATDVSSSSAENSRPSPDLGYSFAEKGNGTTGFSYSIAENVKTSPNLGYSISEKGKGATEGISSLSGNGNDAAKHPAGLPDKIDVALLPLSLIRSKIRTATHYKGRESALISTALLFVHIYNGGDGGYPALSKVTKLSTGGLAKMLMSLRKKGLIKNKGYRQPALTEASLNILRQAWAVRFPQAAK
jgi:hypothetical protein